MTRGDNHTGGTNVKDDGNNKNQNNANIIVSLHIQHHRRPHPTAQAFFRALDEGNNDGDDFSYSAAHKSPGTNLSPQPSSSLFSSSSPFIQRRALSLGWRNRYSQCDEYPVKIRMRIRIKNDGNEDNTITTSHQKDSMNNRNEQQHLLSSPSRPMQFAFKVRQIQRGEIDGTYGTGATVWPAAMVLMKYLEHHSTKFVEDRVVVDLGTGTGVTSIAAALLGASTVYCTDGINSVVQLARHNVQQVADTFSAHAVYAAASSANTAASTSTCDTKHQQQHNDDVHIGKGDTMKDAQDGRRSTIDADDGGGGEKKDRNFKSSSSLSPSTFIISNCPVHVQKYWWGTDMPPFKAKAPSVLTSPPPPPPPSFSSAAAAVHCNQTVASASTTDTATSDKAATLILVADCVLPKLYPIGPLVQAIEDCLADYVDDSDDNNRSADDCDGDDDPALQSSQKQQHHQLSTTSTLTASSNSSTELSEQKTQMNPMALLSYEHRYYPDYDPRIKFRELCRQKQLQVDVVPRQEYDTTYQVDDIEIWRVTRIRLRAKG